MPLPRLNVDRHFTELLPMRVRRKPCLVACVAGTLGHLVMKAIKRDRGVQNWGSHGKGITGASGLLDRVDALAFAAPVFFQSVRWTFGV